MKFTVSFWHQCWALALPAVTGKPPEPLPPTRLGQKAGSHENTQKHHTTGYGIIPKPRHGWSWESSVRTTLQLKLGSAQENSNNQLLSAHCWHHKITKISLFLDMWDLWSWISHWSLIPSCPPIHNTLHFCSAAFLHKSHKLPAPNTSSPSSLPALLFSANLSFHALCSVSLLITQSHKQETENTKVPIKNQSHLTYHIPYCEHQNSNKPHKLDSPK